jgi:hypothetical protein
VEEQPAFE